MALGDNASVDRAFDVLWGVYDSGAAITASAARRVEHVAQRANAGAAYLLRGFVASLAEPRDPSETAPFIPEIDLDSIGLGIGRGVPALVLARVEAQSGPEAAAALRERARFAVTSWDHGDTAARRMVESIAVLVHQGAPMDPQTIAVAKRVLRAVPAAHANDRIDLRLMIALAAYITEQEAA